jgi:uncharacterized protein (TIGR00369 family)
MHKPIEVTEGPWAGWSYWPADNWEVAGGPFYYRRRDDGTVLASFRVEKKHLNGGGAVHGGCLLTFADYACFAIGEEAIDNGRAVTVNLSGDFLSAAFEGDVLEATGEVTRSGARLIYIRGVVKKADGKAVLSFTSVLARVDR